MSGAPPRPLQNICRHLLIGLLQPANRLTLILLVQTTPSLLDFASSLARPLSLVPPPPHCGRCGRHQATSTRCRPGRAQGRQGTQTLALDSWAGSTGTGHPPQPHHSSGRRWMAVGLGGDSGTVSDILCQTNHVEEPGQYASQTGTWSARPQNKDGRPAPPQGSGFLDWCFWLG